MADRQSTPPFRSEQTRLSSGIYRIRCTVNGKVYVGSAVNIAARWRTHANALAANRHHSRPLQNAWNKHGAGSFAFEVIEAVEPGGLIAAEQRHIDAAKSFDRRHGYNVCPKAGSTLGVKASDETRAKLSAAQRGCHKPGVSEANRTRVHTPESRAKKSAAGRGRTPSDATRQKLREAMKTPEREAHLAAIRELSLTDEARAKKSAALKGRRYSPETTEKMRAARLGTKASEETRKKLSEARRGKIQSEETRRKRGEALKGRPLSGETRQKLREAWVRRRQAAATTDPPEDP